MAPEKNPEKKPEEFATYVSIKVDDQVLPLIKAAAALAGMSVQEYVSDRMNAVAAADLEKKPVKRRPIRKDK